MDRVEQLRAESSFNRDAALRLLLLTLLSYRSSGSSATDGPREYLSDDLDVEDGQQCPNLPGLAEFSRVS